MLPSSPFVIPLAQKVLLDVREIIEQVEPDSWPQAPTVTPSVPAVTPSVYNADTVTNSSRGMTWALNPNYAVYPNGQNVPG